MFWHTKQRIEVAAKIAEDEILELLNQRVNSEVASIIKHLVDDVVRASQDGDYVVVAKVAATIACENGRGAGSSPVDSILNKDQLDIYNRALDNRRNDLIWVCHGIDCGMKSLGASRAMVSISLKTIWSKTNAKPVNTDLNTWGFFFAASNASSVAYA
jgi:hypothetical protein